MYSFVIPVYNVKNEYLKQCLDSILVNNEDNIEVIVVDDASSNGCGELCDKYAEQDKRVKVFHRSTNAGVSSARNFGIDNSIGEWVIFVDSDDWIDNNTIDVLNSVDKNDVDIIVFSAFRETATAALPFGTVTGEVTYTFLPQGQELNEAKESCGIKELSDKMLKTSLKNTDVRYETVKYCWGKCFSREFFITKGLRFVDLPYCEDIVFMADAFLKAKKAIQIPNRLYHYRVSASSVVNSFRPNAPDEQRRFLKALQDVYGTDKNPSIYYAALLAMQICIARCYYHKSNRVSLLRRHRLARKDFSTLPYSDVFRYVEYRNMKKKEKWKAILIKLKLYGLYYWGTEYSRKKSVRYQ